VALYVGGHGSPDQEFSQRHHGPTRLRRRRQRIQELYLAGQEDEAIATVADERVDLKSPVGQTARIRERYRAWEGSGADSLGVRSRQPGAIEVMTKAARLN
jgi:hypothetical protein